jgi:hypothetical protein
MLYVALVEATALIVLVSLFSQMLRSVLRSSARREDALIDKVLHTAGMPWTPAPADRQSQEPIDWEEQMERLTQHYSRFTTSPEQEP